METGGMRRIFAVQCFALTGIDLEEHSASRWCDPHPHGMSSPPETERDKSGPYPVRRYAHHILGLVLTF
jgi:hypothetical protein